MQWHKAISLQIKTTCACLYRHNRLEQWKYSCFTKDQVADVLTKGHSKAQFLPLPDKLRVFANPTQFEGG